VIRSVRLRVIGGSVEIRDDVPASRADCPTPTSTKPCPHIKCKHHLWLVDGRDRPGRPWPGKSSELRPVWLHWPLPPSCELAVTTSDPDGMLPRQIAALLGVGSQRSVELIAKRAIEKLRALASTSDRDDIEPMLARLATLAASR
jgi:hypothetical protein